MKKQMRKLAAVLLAMVMAMGTAMPAFAEESEAAEEAPALTELNWEQGEAFIEQAGLEGDFVTFDEIACKLWVPAELQALELTDEDREEGYIGYFQSEDESKVIAVQYVNMDGMDLDTYQANVEAMEGVTDLERGIFNGLEGLTYMMPDQDSGTLAFTTQMGYILEITYVPVSDAEFFNAVSASMCSIQPVEEAGEAAEEETVVEEETAA